MRNLTMEEIEALLPTDKNNLDAEVERHAEIAGAIAREVALAEATRDETSDVLKIVEARLLVEIKNSADKVTDTEAKAKVLIEPSRIDAADQLVVTDTLYKRWRGLQDAWRDKGFGHRVLTDLYVANYFTTSSSTRPRNPNYDKADEAPPVEGLRRRSRV